MRLFARQVYVFGMSRVTLYLLYPDSLKLVHLLPAMAVIGSCALVLLAIFAAWWFILPLAAYLLAIFVMAWISTKRLSIALKVVPASILQLGGYGCGFIKAFFLKIILRKGRNIEEEIAIRKGK